MITRITIYVSNADSSEMEKSEVIYSQKDKIGFRFANDKGEEITWSSFSLDDIKTAIRNKIKSEISADESTLLDIQ